MSLPSGAPSYKAKWLEAQFGRGVQSYFNSGTSPFPPNVKYIVYPIRYIGSAALGSFACSEVIRLNPWEIGGTQPAIGTQTEVIPYVPATNSNGTPLSPPPITIPTDNQNYWYGQLDPNAELGNVLISSTLYENQNKVYAYIIKAYDSDQITNPAAMTGCVAQVTVYGRIIGPLAINPVTFVNTPVYVNWNINLQGLPLTNTYVETLTLPVRYFNGVFLLPQIT
jgi:hypothetical protein